MIDSEFYRALLRAYIDSANDGIFVLCDEMKFHVANPILQFWLGTSEDSLTEHNCRRPITDFIGNEESRQLFTRHFKILLAGQPVRFECFIHPAGAVERWIEISINKVNLDVGDMFVGVARDITEKKSSEALIWQQANFDALTGLANRHMFQEPVYARVFGLGYFSVCTELWGVFLRDGRSRGFPHGYSNCIAWEPAGLLTQPVYLIDVLIAGECINIQYNQYVMYFYGSRLRFSGLLFLFQVNLLQQHVGGLLQ